MHSYRGSLMRLGLLLSCAVLASSCGRIIPNRGGGNVKAPADRPIAAEDVALAPGYAIEPVAAGLTFPTGMAFDDAGHAYVIESGYSYGEVFTAPKLLRLEPDGRMTTVATGENNGPWNGVAFHDGAFYVSEGGAVKGGRLLRITRDGKIEALVENLPSGDHHTDGPAIGPDGKIYFAQGTVTNAAVIGEDNAEFGWLKRNPGAHDVPCRDVTLAGENFETRDVLKGGDGKVSTGAFQPFGTATQKGQVVKGALPCSGAVMRIAPSGGAPELVAWGFRNPFGLAFSPDGKLLVSDNGYDVRGSRPVWGNADWLWIVDPQREPLWHGWPDYADGRKVTEARYKPPGGRQPTKILAADPNPPQTPLAFFATHSSSNGLDVSRSDAFGFAGQAFVAQFGDQTPVTGKTAGPAGFKVVRVDLSNGIIEEFASNRGKENGPASYLKRGGLERPVAVRFSPDGSALYVVDFGVMMMDKAGARPLARTGVLWRITRTGGR
jgi:glucose/arabinose dehydrogenase